METGAAPASMKVSARPPGASTKRAVARQEGLRRLPVQSHYLRLVPLYFDCD